MLKRLTLAILAAGSLFAFEARAQTEISFYYPVAVGGPITKIIDGLAAGFEKENPGVKIKPIYSGTYQDSIVACRAGSETLTVRLPRAAHLAPGAGVRLSWQSTAAHYFDAATGLRAEPPAARIVA